MNEKQTWYKNILKAVAEEQNQSHPQYKGSWDGDNWVPMIANRNIKLHGVLVAEKGEIFLMDTKSFCTLTAQQTEKKNLIGHTFATFYVPKNFGGTNTSLDLAWFDKV